MCTVLLPPGVNPIAVKHITSYHYEDLDQMHHLAHAHTRMHTHTPRGDTLTLHFILLVNTNESNVEFAKTMSFKNQRYSMHHIKYRVLVCPYAAPTEKIN